MTGDFSWDDLALLVDRKGRRYMIRLQAGKQFHSHAGVLEHEQLLTAKIGQTVRTASGGRFVVYRPTLSDYILQMPRGAQVIYPKDIGAMLMFADIAPGQRVFESGVGSGALSLGLLRMGANVVGYDINQKFAQRAQTNVAEFLGAAALQHYQIEIADSYDGIAAAHRAAGFDRFLLDLPEPWQVAPHLLDAAAPGAIVLAYSPSVMQVSRFTQACEQAGFGDIETMEVLHRGWHVKGEAVRPDHRMVAHTGFLTRARLVEARPTNGPADEPKL